MSCAVSPATPNAASRLPPGRRQSPALLRRLLRARDRIDAASHEAWPVGRLARVSGVSETHFARAFAQAFGVPPHRYLLSRRIERAVTLLRDTDLAIIEIAFETGWSSLGSFGRTFRDITGDSPGELRASASEPPSHASSRAPPCYASAAERPRPHNGGFGEAPPRQEPLMRAKQPRTGGPMAQGIGVVGLYVRDQDEALKFYVDKLGFRVHTDARNGDYRWLTVQHPEQASLAARPLPATAASRGRRDARALDELVAKGAMPPLVLVVANCRAAHERLAAAGVEFTQPPVDRYGQVDASFRDPSGNGWKLIEGG